jgi:hypothetical protein
MNTLANVVHFFANKFTGLRGGGFALLLVAFSASNGFSFGHKSSCETANRGQFVFWGRAILSGVCLSVKISSQKAQRNSREEAFLTSCEMTKRQNSRIQVRIKNRSGLVIGAEFVDYFGDDGFVELGADIGAFADDDAQGLEQFLLSVSLEEISPGAGAKTIS